MATWPASLPQAPLLRGYSEQGQGNTIRTQMDVGPPKRRRRYTAELVQYQMMVLLTEAQLATFETFYTSTLSHGADAFDWVDHRAGTTLEYAFVGRPQYTPAGGGLWEVSFTLEAMQ